MAAETKDYEERQRQAGPPDGTDGERPTPDLTGRRIGNYEIVQPLGRGSMGEVYLARHPVLGKEVAVKVLPTELSIQGEAEARFRREAKAESAVQHPSIVEVYDFGTLEDGRSYYVMERLRGRSLQEHLEEKERLSLDETLAIAGPVMEGLAKAHRAGFIHRDLKPDNIVLSTDNEGALRPKIIDFGIAKSSALSPEASVVSLVTRVGTFLGTPLYMSPEQVPGSPDQVGPWSDIYSMGVVLFHMLAGAPPFMADTPMKMAVHHLNTPPPPLDVIRPDLPKRVNEVIGRALAKKPDDRYPDMQVFLDALRSLAKEAADSKPGKEPAEATAHPGTKPAAQPEARPAAKPQARPAPPAAVGAAAGAPDAIPASSITLPEEDSSWLGAPRKSAIRAAELPGDGAWTAHPRLSGRRSTAAYAAAVRKKLHLEGARLWVAVGVVVVGALAALAASVLYRASAYMKQAGVIPAPRAVQVSLGRDHGCMTLNGGTVWCWGDNKGGQLGIGTTRPSRKPVQVANLPIIRSVAAGRAHTCALTKIDSAVYCWGKNAKTLPGQVAGLKNILSVSAGSDHTCVLKRDGSVWCWGDNRSGQLGKDKGPPTQVPVRVKDPVDVQAVAAGAAHTCALKHDHWVWCWGDNSKGQLGAGHTEPQTTAVRVMDMAAVQAVSAGANHTCALKQNGSVWCWGENSKGQLGVKPGPSENRAVQVTQLRDMTMISAGNGHTCAVGKDRSVWCWGDNRTGQVLGTPSESRHTPVRLDEVRDVRSVSCGGFHTCVLTGRGDVRCWGRLFETGPALSGVTNFGP